MKAFLLGLLFGVNVAQAYTPVLTIGRGGTNSISTAAALAQLGAFPSTGGTMSGTLLVPQINGITATELSFLSGLTTNVQSAIGSGGAFVPLSGGTMSGGLVTPSINVLGALGAVTSVVAISSSNAIAENLTSAAFSTLGFTQVQLIGAIPPSTWPGNSNPPQTSFLEGSTNGTTGWTSIPSATVNPDAFTQNSVTSAVIPITYPFVRTNYIPSFGTAGQFGFYTVADVSGSLNNTSFTAHRADTDGGALYCFWFNIGGAGSDPCVSGTHVEIDAATNATRSDIADAMQTFVAAVTGFTGSQHLGNVGGVDNFFLFTFDTSGTFVSPDVGNTGFTAAGWDPPGPLTLTIVMSSPAASLFSPQLGLKAPGGLLNILPNASQALDITWTLPADSGTTGQVLTTDGSGNLSWASGGTFSTVTANDITTTGGDINVGSGGTVRTENIAALSGSAQILVTSATMFDRAGHKSLNADLRVGTDASGNDVFTWAFNSSLLASELRVKSGSYLAIDGLSSSALVIDVNGHVAASPTTDTELGYVSGVTGPIQAQINSKTTLALVLGSACAITASDGSYSASGTSLVLGCTVTLPTVATTYVCSPGSNIGAALITSTSTTGFVVSAASATTVDVLCRGF